MIWLGIFIVVPLVVLPVILGKTWGLAAYGVLFFTGLFCVLYAGLKKKRFELLPWLSTTNVGVLPIMAILVVILGRRAGSLGAGVVLVAWAGIWIIHMLGEREEDVDVIQEEI